MLVQIDADGSVAQVDCPWCCALVEARRRQNLVAARSAASSSVAAMVESERTRAGFDRIRARFRSSGHSAIGSLLVDYLAGS